MRARSRYLDLLLATEFNETARTSTAIFGGTQLPILKIDMAARQ
jgi:hypothetical protein